MWRNFRFQYMTDVEKSEISPHEEEFQFFHTTDVEKCENSPNLEEFHISPHDRCEEIQNLPCFVVVKSVLWQLMLFCHEIYFVVIYALLRGEN